MTDHDGTLIEIAVMAVSDLGGATRSVDTEDVAIRCHEIAPGVFSWRKYKTQVNLELVRVSLSDAKKQKNGQLVSGSGREGWRLTRHGLDWATKQERNRLAVPSQHANRRRIAGSIDTVRRAREIARLEASPAWLRWRDTQLIAESEARELFRIDSYADDRLTDIKITRMLALFEVDTEYRRFLEIAATLITNRNADG